MFLQFLLYSKVTQPPIPLFLLYDLIFPLQLNYSVLSISTLQQSDPVILMRARAHTHTHTHTHIYTFSFSHYSPSCSITSDQIQSPMLYSRISLLLATHSNLRDRMQFPVLYSRTLLPIHSKCKSVSTNPEFPISPPLSPLPPGKHKSALHVHDLFLALWKDHLCHILDSTYK